MAQTKEQAVARAVADLSGRLGIKQTEISTTTIEDADFPDLSLGAPVDGEMSGQMIAAGWRISLSAAGKNYEYRADKENQLRLYGFNGKNYLIQ